MTLRSWLLALLLFALPVCAQMQHEKPNGLLLVAKPGLLDPNFRETVVLVSQAADGSTVGVILNRPTARRHDATGEPIWFGGPVMREVLVTLFRSARAPDAPAFHVLKGIYLSMRPQHIEQAVENRRLFAGFAGWAPGQLESELARDDWFVLPASAEILFRNDMSGIWEELVRKARGRVAMR
jgi:putative transcriptional regulator